MSSFTRLLFTGAITASCFALACSGDDKDDDDTGDDTDVCANTVTPFPASGASGVYYRSTVEFTFGTKEDDAEIKLTAGGTDIPGTSAWVGNTLVFTPTAPLAASTQHAATATYSCGTTAEITWTTSEVGSAVAPDDIAGATYSLDLASGRFVEPAGVGAIIGSLLSGVDFDILIGVDTATASNIGFIGAISGGGSPPTQDLCTETIDFPVAADYAANPFFIVESNALPLDVQGISLVINDLTLSGAFAPGGAYIAGAVLAGSIDTRPLVPLLDEGGDDDAACNTVAAFGVTCLPCSSDNQPYCLSIYVDGIVADEVPGLTLMARSADDIAADSSCTAQ